MNSRNAGGNRRSTSIYPHPLHRGELFERDVWLDIGATRSLASKDLGELCGTVDETNPSLLVAGANGQVVRCTGMVMFTIDFEGNSTVVSAWVSLLIQGEVLFDYQTLIDLGLVQASPPSENPAVAKFFPEPEPDSKDVENNDPGKLPGDGANDGIPSEFLTPFHYG